MTAPAESAFGPFDRLPPHTIESEMCVLSSIVLDAEVRAEVMRVLRRDDFFQADHQIIFDAIAERFHADTPIDWHLIREDLFGKQLLSEIGGEAYLAQIVGAAPSAAHGLHYAMKVIQCSRLRSIISIGNQAIRQSYVAGAQDEWEKIIKENSDDAQSLLKHGTRETVRHIRAVMDEALERKCEGKVKRIPTGLRTLDNLSRDTGGREFAGIGGLGLGRTTIIGGRPGSGKSLFGKQIALNTTGNGIATGIVTIEEDRFKVADNLLSNQSGISNSDISYERVPWDRLIPHADELAKRPLYLDDQCSDIASVEASITRMAMNHGCQVIIVDYLQLISPEDDKSGTREQEVRKLSNALKLTFKRLNVAGVVLAQLNRAGGIEPPQLHNLRESGAIEQDGDLILLLHRPDYYECNNPGFVPTHVIEVNVAKNKDGPAGVVPLTFDGRTQSIYDIGESNDIP